jgi:hypothetical protein
MKTAFFLLLFCISSLPAEACTFAEFKRDSVGREAARAAFEASDFDKTIVLFNKLLCKDGLAAMDKRKLLVAYAMKGNAAGVAKTLRSIDVRYFAQSGDEIAAFDLYFSSLPAKYTLYKTEARNRLQAFLDTVRGKPNFEYLRHEYLVDQARQKNPVHDSLTYYGDWTAGQKLKKAIAQNRDLYAYVQKQGFPTLGVAGNYPETLLMQDQQRINYYLPLAIAAAEKGELDWQVVEHLELQKWTMDNQKLLTTPAFSDTFAYHFLNEECKFAPGENAKRIQDTLLKRAKQFRVVQTIMAIDSTFKITDQLSFKFSNDHCEHYWWYSFSVWMNAFLEEKKIFVDYSRSLSQ